MSIPRVKICCISSIEEARTAIDLGASALGLVSKMPSGPGVIDDESIRRIAEIIPPPVSSFLLTSETNSEQIIEHHSRVHTSTIQIVDALENRDYDHLRRSLPGVKLVQVIHVIDESSVEEAVSISAHVDALLLDSGNPNLAVKVLGGTGRTHDWGLSRAIRDAIDIPLFLAGGLNKDNVQQAIKEVDPFGLDLCSGVRTNGNLDRQKLREFMSAVRASG